MECDDDLRWLMMGVCVCEGCRKLAKIIITIALKNITKHEKSTHKNQRRSRVMPADLGLKDLAILGRTGFH